MASFIFSEAANQIAKADIDFDLDDFSLLLLKNGQVAANNVDAANLDSFSPAIARFGGSGYADKLLASPTISENGGASPPRTEIIFTDVTWSALGSDSATTPGAIIYKRGTPDTDPNRVPVAFIDGGGFPFDGSGSDITLDLNDAGAIQIRCITTGSASFWYTNGAEQLARGNIDLNDAGTEIKVLLVTTGSDAATLKSAATVSAFDAGTLKEYDAASYVRKILSSKTVTPDNTNNQAEFYANATTVWSTLEAEVGGDQCIGAVIYKNVSGDVDATNIPIFFCGDGGFPFNGSGSDVTFTWDAANGVANLQHG